MVRLKYFFFPKESINLFLIKDHRSSAKNSLKSHKFNTPFPRYLAFLLFYPSEIAFSSNYRWQNRKESPNGSTNNGDMVDKAKRDVVSQSKTFN